MNNYVELVSRRFEDRAANILSGLEKVGEQHLRFTVRVFGDCLDEEGRMRLLGKYTEYMAEDELRAFAREFVSAYTEYAIEELKEKKKEGERFDPPYLTQEEYQEMAVREKWPRIVLHLDQVPLHQLRRELARMALLFRPYMISDPGFNEGVLEFALYYDLLERLQGKSEGALRELARRIGPHLAGAADLESRDPDRCAGVLAEVRQLVARDAGIPADPERLLGPEMERYPRTPPPGYNLRELRRTLAGMSLRDVRLSAMAHMELLTSEEMNELVLPYVTRFPSFYEIPGNVLRELVVATAERAGERHLTYFFERFDSGRMAMGKEVSFVVWRLMPEEEKLRHLREDDAKMDLSMISRHLVRYLRAADPAELSDRERQIALLTDSTFAEEHGTVLKGLGAAEGGEALRRLYDEVTARCLRMVSRPREEWPAEYDRIREKIFDLTGIKRRLPGIKKNGGKEEG
jgi:hypothetical protein